MFRPASATILVFCLILGSYPSKAMAQAFNTQEINLFNSKNFLGWQKFSSNKKANLEELFAIDPFEKHIIIKGTSPGYLVTEKMYGDYELSFDWRWPPEPEGVNAKPNEVTKRLSGVLFHIAGEGDLIWPKSIQADLRLGRAGDLNLMSGFRLKVNPERKDPKNAQHFLRSHDGVERPVAEWNQCVIICHGKFVSISINGTMVVAGRESEYSKGRIALQSESGEIHFRNLVMKPMTGKPVDPEKDN